MSSLPRVEKQTALRCFGALALVAGIVEFIVDIIVYTDTHGGSFGAWWSGIGIMVGSFLGVLATSRFVSELFSRRVSTLILTGES